MSSLASFADLTVTLLRLAQFPRVIRTIRKPPLFGGPPVRLIVRLSFQYPSTYSHLTKRSSRSRSRLEVALQRFLSCLVSFLRPFFDPPATIEQNKPPFISSILILGPALAPPRRVLFFTSAFQHHPCKPLPASLLTRLRPLAPVALYPSLALLLFFNPKITSSLLPIAVCKTPLLPLRSRSPSPQNEHFPTLFFRFAIASFCLPTFWVLFLA